MKTLLKPTISTIALTMSLLSIQAHAVKVLDEPEVKEVPEAQVMDRNHVNIASGAVSPSLATVSIGTERFSLSHRIATHGNYFQGYLENYDGAINHGYLKTALTGLPEREVLTVRTGLSSENFEEIDGDYISLQNPQSKLSETGSSYIYTNDKGDEYRFTKNSAPSKPIASLNEIVRADGFTIYINRGVASSGGTYRSISTNNGLQLKFLFKSLNDWWRSHPEKVVAINNAYEVCGAESISCSLSEEWPTTKFHWSANVNNIVSTSASWTFEVTGPTGRKATYFHEPHDRFEGGYFSGGNVSRYTPRITRIEDSISGPGRRVIEYEYDNVIQGVTGQMAAYDRVSEIGVVKKVTENNEEWTYNVANNNCAGLGCTLLSKDSGGYQAVTRMVVDALRGVPTLIETSDGTITRLSRDYENRVTSIRSPEGDGTSYHYDDRGRLEEVRRFSSEAEDEAQVTTFDYPDGCPNPKTCNKPKWMKDARGYTTNYTYHSQSGYIETITKPADRNGVRPQIRYTYEKKYARYKTDGGSYQTANRGIWLLTERSECREGQYTTTGCVSPSDEIVTEYEYGDTSEPNNLFLIGKVVKAGGTERRTCYQYDKLGNVIGETLPKENLSDCP